MHPDVAAIRFAKANARIARAARVVATEIDMADALKRFEHPPVPAYEREAVRIHKHEALADIFHALAESVEPFYHLDVDSDVVTALTAEGYTSDEELSAATDEELLAVVGVGPKALVAIRSVAPYNSDADDGDVDENDDSYPADSVMPPDEPAGSSDEAEAVVPLVESRVEPGSEPADALPELDASDEGDASIPKPDVDAETGPALMPAGGSMNEGDASASPSQDTDTHHDIPARSPRSEVPNTDAPQGGGRGQARSGQPRRGH